tara:strand:+ start:45 stop:527 length:483 start_codon:yes stop_codon:yes gene_type:complete
MNRQQRRANAKLNDVKVGFVDQIMNNLDITQHPQRAIELMVTKMLQTPKRKQILRDTGEVTVNYTITPNNVVHETPMQKGVDKGVKNLIVMDDHEAIKFGKRHGVLIIKDSATQSKKWISNLDSALQNAIAQHGDLYIGKMYFGDQSGEYYGVGFSKEVA